MPSCELTCRHQDQRFTFFTLPAKSSLRVIENGRLRAMAQFLFLFKLSKVTRVFLGFVQEEVLHYIFGDWFTVRKRSSGKGTG